MPIAPPKPCKHHGCGQLVRDGSGYCANHQRPRSGTFADRARGSRHERGYGAEWERQRKQALMRDAGLCQPCRQQGRISVAKQVDHIRPKAAGGTDDLDNLQSICVACHQAKTDREKNHGRGV
jgi:5-methylcytosine-specific restriction protein A